MTVVFNIIDRIRLRKPCSILLIMLMSLSCGNLYSQLDWLNNSKEEIFRLSSSVNGVIIDGESIGPSGLIEFTEENEFPMQVGKWLIGQISSDSKPVLMESTDRIWLNYQSYFNTFKFRFLISHIDYYLSFESNGKLFKGVAYCVHFEGNDSANRSFLIYEETNSGLLIRKFINGDISDYGLYETMTNVCYAELENYYKDNKLISDKKLDLSQVHNEIVEKFKYNKSCH